MKLAVDARNVYRTQRRGTGKNLIDLYRRVAELRPDWQLIMYHQAEAADDPFAQLPNVARCRIDIRGDRWNLWQDVRLPAAMRRTRADLLHCPANTAPRRAGAPTVVTIHDLIPLDERFADARTGGKWRCRVRAAARKARTIITPSEFSKSEIADTFAVPAEKIVVNPWAADSTCRQVDDPMQLAAVRAKYCMAADQPYVVGFGGADPRKNTEGILRAWAALPAALRESHRLVLVGIQPAPLEKFTHLADELDIEPTCRLYGFAEEEDLPALISGAAALCYASRSEGFGLPLLDAFACGTPVLTGAVTSLPEVAGDAALLVDPEDPQAIARGLERLLTDPAGADDLVRRGRERLKRYTWQACAERAVAAFEQALR